MTVITHIDDLKQLAKNVCQKCFTTTQTQAATHKVHTGRTKTIFKNQIAPTRGHQHGRSQHCQHHDRSKRQHARGDCAHRHDGHATC